MNKQPAYLYPLRKTFHAEKFATFSSFSNPSDETTYYELLTIHDYRVGQTVSLSPQLFKEFQHYLQKRDEFGILFNHFSKNEFYVASFQRDIFYKYPVLDCAMLSITINNSKALGILYTYLSEKLEIGHVHMNFKDVLHIPLYLFCASSSAFTSAFPPTNPL